MDASVVIGIHQHMSGHFSSTAYPVSPEGVKNLSGVESAVARKDASFGGVDLYPDIYQKAGALFHSLTGNHAFHNGNKRTALLSLLVFLSEKGISLDSCPDDEMFLFTWRVASGDIGDAGTSEVEAIAAWLEMYARQGDHPGAGEVSLHEQLDLFLEVRADVFWQLAQT